MWNEFVQCKSMLTNLWQKKAYSWLVVGSLITISSRNQPFPKHKLKKEKCGMNTHIHLIYFQNTLFLKQTPWKLQCLYICFVIKMNSHPEILSKHTDWAGTHEANNFYMFNFMLIFRLELIKISFHFIYRWSRIF